MRTLRIAMKMLLELWREPQIFWLFLLFPALLVGVYYIGYGQSEQGMSSFLVLLVCNEDRGSHGTELVSAFRNARFDGQPIYQVREVVDCRSAERTLADGRAAVLMTVSEDFSEKWELGEPVSVIWMGDAQSDPYVFAASFAGGVLAEFQGIDASQMGVSYEFIGGTGNLNDFQVGIPGVMVFGVLFGSITGALLLVRERVNGTVQRLQLSRMQAGELIGGLALTNLFLGLVQAGLSFALALACGFESHGSLFMAGLIVALVSLTATGLGALAAAYSKNDGEASNIATALLAPFAFLSGAVFPMPVVRWFEIGGRSISPYDIFSTAHATNALKRILIFGEGVDQVFFELGMLILLSFAVLMFGAWQFRRVIR